MKELEKHNRDSDKQSIEVIQEKKQQQEFRFDSSLRPVRGHTVFEINTKTFEVKEAEYKKHERITWWEALKIYNGEDVLKKEIIKEKDCVYISALNAKNALKRFQEGKGSKKMNKKKNIKLF